jgi:hypothetical protein
MPTVSFSSGLSSAFNQASMEFFSGYGGGTSSPFSDAGFMRPHGGSSTVCAVFYIMKGAVPTDLAALTSISIRQSDILVTFDTANGTGFSPNGTTNDFIPSNTSTNPIIVNTLYRNATATGTATWFWWVVGRSNGSANGMDLIGPIYNQIAGTVGATGSGADLTLPSTAVVSGQSYRVADMQLQFPTTWTY